MSKPEAIAAMVEQANAAFGRSSILVNNAGIQFVSPLESFTDRQNGRNPVYQPECRFPCQPPGFRAT